MNPRLVVYWSLLSALLLAQSAAAEDAAEETAKPAASPVYLLRYQFRKGEIIRWKVVHQALVRTTVSGTTQTAETHTESIKVWVVNGVDDKEGQATFVHSVESVDMRQSVSGRQDVHFNSATDAVVPPEFDEVSKAVGVPLSTIVIDNRGHIIKRHEERAQPNGNPGEMTVPLPEEPVALNHTWSQPHDANVRQKDGSIRPIKTRQQFTLVAVDDGIATIRIETIVLTPIHDPALEAQLIQHVTNGDVRFDISAGRLVGQKIDIDKRVVGFQGEASSMHYLTRFTEELMRDQPATAGAGKPAPKRATEASPAPQAESSDIASPAGDAAGAKAAAGAAPSTAATKTAPAAAARKGGNLPKGRAAAPSTAGNKTAAKTPNKQSPAKPKSKTGSKPTTTQQKRG